MKTIEEEFPPAAVFRYDTSLADAYTRLRARAAEMERAQQWRPIAEAPRDGTLVDLWGSKSGDWIQPRLEPRRFCDCYHIPPAQDWQAERWFSRSEGDIKPTHFRPLPPAPEIHQTNK